MILVNGIAGETIGVRDRGLAYGDGVFRTFLLWGGKPVLWQRQYAKLVHDCGALGIGAPARDDLEHDLAQIDEPACAVKIIVTRGESARGYAPSPDAKPNRIVMTAALPQYPAHFAADGVDVRLCKLKLAPQERLAGIKHLNRLENVLARGEWNDPAIAEGLLCDSEGNLVGGTMSNVFIVRHGRLFTPDLNRCGVKGVMRELVIELAAMHGIPVNVDVVSLEQLRDAECAFVVNSLIGLWPVARLDGQPLKRNAMATHMQNWIRDAQSA